MSAEIIPLAVWTTLDTSPGRMLTAAADRGLEKAVVVGIEADGTLFFASSQASSGDTLLLLALAKKRLLELADGGE